MTGLDLHSGTALLLLGAAHGLNPGMGWLFAVALGLQERRRGALWGALPPLAAGHAGAILAALAAAALLGRALPITLVEWIVGDADRAGRHEVPAPSAPAGRDAGGP